MSYILVKYRDSETALDLVDFNQNDFESFDHIIFSDIGEAYQEQIKLKQNNIHSLILSKNLISSLFFEIKDK